MNAFHAGVEIKPSHPLIVGVINLSPESFYGGSVAKEEDTIEEKIKQFAKYDVDCLDVGAMSTRPLEIYGGKQASIREEESRVKDLLPSLMEIADLYELPVALDTQHPSVAKLGIDMGVRIINDISGFKTDHTMPYLLADYDIDVVVMATNSKPGDPCGVDATMQSLQESIQIGVDAGIDRDHIAIDPGFGGWQGRAKECDIYLLKEFIKFSEFGLPIYIGISRKSTIHTLNGGDNPEDRLAGSLILTSYLIKNGANIIRTHDVKDTRLALNVLDSLDHLDSFIT